MIDLNRLLYAVALVLVSAACCHYLFGWPS